MFNSYDGRQHVNDSNTICRSSVATVQDWRPTGICASGSKIAHTGGKCVTGRVLLILK